MDVVVLCTSSCIFCHCARTDVRNRKWDSAENSHLRRYPSTGTSWKEGTDMPGHACPHAEKHATGLMGAQNRLQPTFRRCWNWGNLPWSHSSLQARVKKDSSLPGSKWCCKDCVQHKDHADSLGWKMVGRTKPEKLAPLQKADVTESWVTALCHIAFVLLPRYELQVSTQDRTLSRQAPTSRPCSYLCNPGAPLPTSNHKYLQFHLMKFHMMKACKNFVRREKQMRKGSGRVVGESEERGKCSNESLCLPVLD